MVVEDAKRLILKGKSLLVLTGAGISKESGIPVFRGKDGLWNKYRPEELATPQAFAKNPELVWEWYRYRRNIIRRAKPNLGHYAIKHLEEIKEEFLLATQNVDGLHIKAGNKKIVELHGNIFITRCIKCGYEIEEYKEDSKEKIPKCEKCGGIMRPGVVWFGEPLPEHALKKAFEFAEKAEVILVVGTSGIVYPAAHLPLIVKQKGGKIIEINIEESAITPYADIFIKSPAGKILPEITKN